MKYRTAWFHKVDVEILVHSGAIGLAGVIHSEPVLGTVGRKDAKDHLIGKGEVARQI